MKELTPVVLIGNAPLVMLTAADAPYNTVGEFIQAARAKPGEFSYGSVGAGTPGHLSAVALALGAKLNMTHVPYKGVGPLIPTVAESGLPGFSYTLWGGLFAPTGTPDSVIDSLNKDVNAILASAEIRSRLETDNVAVPRNSPAEFADFVKSEAQKFEKLIKDANLKREQ